MSQCSELPEYVIKYLTHCICSALFLSALKMAIKNMIEVNLNKDHNVYGLRVHIAWTWAQHFVPSSSIAIAIPKREAEREASVEWSEYENEVDVENDIDWLVISLLISINHYRIIRLAGQSPSRRP